MDWSGIEVAHDALVLPELKIRPLPVVHKLLKSLLQIEGRPFIFKPKPLHTEAKYLNNFNTRPIHNLSNYYLKILLKSIQKPGWYGHRS